MVKGRKRADFVPAAPIIRALKAWLKEHEYVNVVGQRESNYGSPFKILAEKMKVSEDAVWRYTKNDRHYESMHFDVADKILCATNRFDWWWSDPELSEVYESAVKGADKIYPLAVSEVLAA